jgi:hypothetical protein
MTAPEIVLDETQIDLLFQVKAGRVSYSKGVYRLRETGQPDVSTGVQLLRALGLVRMVELTDRRRIPPTRATELTDKGEQVAATYA